MEEDATFKIYWDEQDKADAGWAYRLRVPFDAGEADDGASIVDRREESGRIDELDDLERAADAAKAAGCDMPSPSVAALRVEAAEAGDTVLADACTAVRSRRPETEDKAMCLDAMAAALSAAPYPRAKKGLTSR